MRLRIGVLVLAAVVVGFLSGRALQVGGTGVTGPESLASAAPAGPQGVQAAPAQARVVGETSAGLGADETRNIEVFRNATASVVYITSIAYQRDYFSMDVLKIPRGTGSGFIWDRDGHIVTNFHVLEEGNSFSVTLSDQSDWEAEVTGVAPDKDLAVLKIKAPRDKLKPLPLGSSSTLVVGQAVLAVGNPFGLDHSLTVGVVSALGRELGSPNGRTIRDIIQTDAAIDPGNSGGPLLDSRGLLVGVNSAIYSPSGGFAGIGFAVPVDTVRRLVPQIIEHGRPVQAGIGVSLLSERQVARLGLKGVAIYRIAPNGPAAKAGLTGVSSDRSGRPALGDIIVAADGKSVNSSDNLLHVFESVGVGGTVELTVVRDDRERKVRLELVALE